MFDYYSFVYSSTYMLITSNPFFSFFHNNPWPLIRNIIFDSLIIYCICCNKPLRFDEARIRYANWYHRRCVWHVAHLIRLDNFFWMVSFRINPKLHYNLYILPLSLCILVPSMVFPVVDHSKSKTSLTPHLFLNYGL